MNNIDFRRIENIKKYLTEGLKSGKFQSKTYQKSGEITARVGKIGEEIFTVMANGLQETKNTVTADEKGCPGWVVTNSTGEQFIVSDSVFKKKYERISETEDRFKPIWKPITAVQIDENICFVAHWGEVQNIVSGGYLVFNKEYDDIYGIQQEEFNKTYDLITFDWFEIDEVVCKDKENYKYVIKNIKKEDIRDFLTSESEIVKAEYIGKNLYLYLSRMDWFTNPIVKEGECYWNCLLVIKNAISESSTIERMTLKISEKRLYDLKDVLKHRSLYMSFKEFLNDGSSDTSISFDGNDLCIKGYGRNFENSSLWVNIWLSFESLEFYCDGIYDYMTGDTIG